ncbi:hypothetical protein EMMF5_002776 [Cystobasidiomycetes sp. EMM_F5]
MSGVFAGNQWTTASGSTWSVIIEPTFVSQVAELANHLALASQDARTASEGIVEHAQAAGDARPAQQKVVDEILQLASERGVNQGAEARDIQGFSNLALVLINSTFQDHNDRNTRVQALASAVAKGQSNEVPTTAFARYASLSSLLNSLPATAPASLRSSLLLRLVQSACARGDTSVLSSALTTAPQWFKKEWQFASSTDADAAIGDIVQALEGVDANESVRRLLLSYCDANTSDSLKHKLLQYTLASTSQDSYDLQSLPSSSSNQQLAQIQKIFISGSIADLDSFLGQNTDLTKPLKAESLREKLQYVILADFCAGKIGESVSYDEIANAVGLKSSDDEEERAMEVESWVIATIRAKLLAARLHQPSSTISVLRASPRTFGTEQWQTLQSRLESWKSSIASIMDVVHRAVGPNAAGQRGPQSQNNREDTSAPTHAGASNENESAAIEVA